MSIGCEAPVTFVFNNPAVPSVTEGTSVCVVLLHMIYFDWENDWGGKLTQKETEKSSPGLKWYLLSLGDITFEEDPLNCIEGWRLWYLSVSEAV